MTILYIVTEVEQLVDQQPESRVVGVYSSKELAQQAMVKSVIGLKAGAESGQPWGQEVTERGLTVADPSGSRYTFDIVVRNLDEIL